MSLIVTVYVNEGIVMASDSRTTYSRTENNVQKFGVHTNNSTNKTFLCPNQAGISTCGEASVKGIPITGFIEAFIRASVTPETPISAMPQALMQYFQQFQPVPGVNFIVAGYEGEGAKRRQLVYKLHVREGKVEQLNTDNQGATWDGEVMVLSKIIQPTALMLPDKKLLPLPHAEILWNFFTLQDAIDFADYAIKTTIDTMHFQNVVETVGEPIDLLVIKPDSAEWIAHKALHA